MAASFSSKTNLNVGGFSTVVPAMSLRARECEWHPGETLVSFILDADSSLPLRFPPPSMLST